MCKLLFLSTEGDLKTLNHKQKAETLENLSLIEKEEQLKDELSKLFARTSKGITDFKCEQITRNVLRELYDHTNKYSW